MTTTYTATSLTAGTTYKFKVQARNAFGLSEYSQEILILAAQIPDQPVEPTTSISGPNVVIAWTPPESNGSPIYSYIIQIRTVDEVTFATDSTDCDGNKA